MHSDTSKPYQPLQPAPLSETQVEFLARASNPEGDRTPFLGGRTAGRAASAWYRTALSLYRLGYVYLAREGDAYRVFAVRGPRFDRTRWLLAQNGALFVGRNHVNGASYTVSAFALRKLERDGIVSVGYSPDGGMMGRARR